MNTTTGSSALGAMPSSDVGVPTTLRSDHPTKRAINARESRELAYAFLGADFLRGQFEFLWSRDKYAPALVFLALLLTRPVWAQFIP